MNPAILLRDALSDGIRLTVTPRRTIQIRGPKDAVTRWSTVLREHKAPVADVLEIPMQFAAVLGDAVELLESDIYFNLTGESE